jgi:hypothetical protein
MNTRGMVWAVECFYEACSYEFNPQYHQKILMQRQRTNRLKNETLLAELIQCDSTPLHVKN